MLELNEKLIRKGKAVGLPYVGSKKKISKKIVEIIKQNFGTDKTVYDVFGGGGAITAELMINGMDVVYNDLDKTITNSFNRVLSQDREWIKTLIVNRETFYEIKYKQYKTTDDWLKLLINSFGNNRKGYLYAKDISDVKYNLAVDIIKKDDVFSGYNKTTTYKNFLFNYENYSQRLEQLEQLEQLTRLNNAIDEIRNSSINKVKTNNKHYNYFSDVKNSILYLDPPYEDAIGYGVEDSVKISDVEYKIKRDKLLNSPEGTVIIENDIRYKLGGKSGKRMYYKNVSDYFDSKRFYDWAFEMSKNNIVLISSYEISDDRFECVYEFKNARSTFSGGKGNKNRHEKLFMVKS